MPQASTAAAHQTNLYETARGQFETRRVLDQTIRVKKARISIDDLVFWEQNPRLLNEFKAEGIKTPTQDQIADHLANHAGPLKDGIQNTGSTQDAIIINSNGDVIEGNRRLWCYRQLRDEGVEGFDTIPVEIYPPETSEEVFYSIISVRHVAGQAEWNPVGKSAVMKQLRTFGWSDERIAKHCGTKRSEVGKYLMAAKFLAEYQRLTKDFDSNKFTTFYCLASCKKARELYTTLPEAKEWIMEMIRTGKIEKSHHGALPIVKVWYNRRAKSVLEKEGSYKAIALVAESKEKGNIGETAHKLYLGLRKLTPLHIATIMQGENEVDRKQRESLYMLRTELEAVWRKMREEA